MIKKSKLLDICFALERKEWKLLLNYLGQRLKDKNQNIITLAQYLSKLSNEKYPAHLTSPEAIWERIYAPTPFSYKKMSYTILINLE